RPRVLQLSPDLDLHRHRADLDNEMKCSVAMTGDFPPIAFSAVMTQSLEVRAKLIYRLVLRCAVRQDDARSGHVLNATEPHRRLASELLYQGARGLGTRSSLIAKPRQFDLHIVEDFLVHIDDKGKQVKIRVADLITCSESPAETVDIGFGHRQY